MPRLPGTWFSRLLTLPQVAELRARVDQLERAEIERESVTAEHIEKLTRIYKRARLRETRDEIPAPTNGKDAIRALLLQRASNVRDPHPPG